MSPFDIKRPGERKVSVPPPGPIVSIVYPLRVSVPCVPQKIRADSDIVSHIAIGTGLESYDLDVLGMPPWPPGEAFRRFDHPLRIDAELLVLEPIDCVFRGFIAFCLNQSLPHIPPRPVCRRRGRPSALSRASTCPDIQSPSRCGSHRQLRR